MSNITDSSIQAKLNNLIMFVNNVTQGSAANLTDAIDELARSKGADNGATNFMTYCTMSPRDLDIVFDAVDTAAKSDIKSITVHPSVSVIGEGVCKDMTKLASISLGKNTTTIEAEAFKGDTALSGVNWPQTTFKIGDNAFDGCTSLLTVPNGVDYEIGRSSFFGCTSLPRDIDLSYATAIAENAFKNCNINTVKLEKITRCGFAPFAYTNINSIECVGTGGFSTNGNCLVQTGIKHLIQGTNNTSELPEDLLTVGSFAFAGLTTIRGITIPHNVTAIGAGAFHDCSNLKSLQILGNIKTNSDLLNVARGCTSISELTLPFVPTVENSNSLSAEVGCQRLGAFFKHESAFQGSTVEHNKYVPETLTDLTITSGTIQDGACSKIASLQTVSLPRAYSIGKSVFERCENLHTLTIGSKENPLSEVTLHGDMVSWCPNLEYVYIHADVDKVTNSGAPSSATNIKEGRLPTAWLYNCSTFTQLENVECYRHTATDKSGFPALKSATVLSYIPAYVPDGAANATTIQRQITPAFCNSSELESITLPSVYQFIDWGHPVKTTFPSGFLTGCPKLAVINFGDTIESWNDTSEFERYTGWIDHDCVVVCTNGLVSALGNNLDSSMYVTFDKNIAKNQGLLSGSTEFLTIPAYYIDSTDKSCKIVTKVGSFESTPQLKTVTISEHVTEIENYAFRNCAGLHEISIPASTTIIGTAPFYGCSSLTNINVAEANTTFMSVDGHVYSKNQDTLWIYAQGRTDSTFTVPNTVTTLEGYAFTGCAGIQTVDCASSVRKIGHACFRESGLETITNINGLTTIDGYAFHKSKLKNIVLPATVTSIGVGAFAGCNDLESLSFEYDYATYLSHENCIYQRVGPELSPVSYILVAACKNSSVPTTGLDIYRIDNAVFQDNNWLTDFVAPKTLSSIGANAFKNSTILQSITLPESLTRIEETAFKDCVNLRTITFEGTLAEWQNISKESDWDLNTPAYIVYCSDGSLEKGALEAPTIYIE